MNSPVLRTLAYIFPLLLILMEWAHRAALGDEFLHYVRFTLAGTGIGFPIAATIPRPINDRLHHKWCRDRLEQENAFVIRRREWRLIEIIWLYIFVALVIWNFTLYLSGQAEVGSTAYFWISFILGVVSYAGGVVLAILKERI